MVEDQARIGDVRVQQLVLASAIVEITIIDVAILIDVIVEGELGLAEGLAVHDDVVGLQSHRLPLRRGL
jgi:hypothetical protein